MAKEVSLHDNDLNSFISGERGKVLSYLRKKYSLSDDDLNDIFQDEPPSPDAGAPGTLLPDTMPDDAVSPDAE